MSDLAERYAPSPSWFVATISEVFRLGGEHVDEGVGHGLCRLIAEQDASLHASAVEAYLGLLDGAVGAAAAAGGGVVPSGKKLPETILLVRRGEAGEMDGLGVAEVARRRCRDWRHVAFRIGCGAWKGGTWGLPGHSGARASLPPNLPPIAHLPRAHLAHLGQVICWVLGEYGHLAARPPGAVLGRLMGLLAAHKTTTDRVRGALLTALAKLAAHTGGAAGPVGAALAAPHGSGGGASGGVCEASPADFVHACLSSQNLELQQRAHELTALLKWVPWGPAVFGRFQGAWGKRGGSVLSNSIREGMVGRPRRWQGPGWRGVVAGVGYVPGWRWRAGANRAKRCTECYGGGSGWPCPAPDCHRCAALPHGHRLPPPLLAAALPVNAAAEDLTSDLGTVVALPFLDGLVNSALAAGAQPYLSPEARGSKGADAQAKGECREVQPPAAAMRAHMQVVVPYMPCVCVCVCHGAVVTGSCVARC